MKPALVHGNVRVFRKFAAACLIAGGALSGTVAQAQAPAPASRPATSPVACPALLQHRFDRLQDEKPQSLCQYSGQVVLVVNTASFCGFTSQYEGLEALYAKYKTQGLVVLGFPANDFGRQEPGNNQAIADFCENTFGVKFPMFSKTSVVGREANPLYKQLAQKTGETPQWNFHKYLIGRDGQTVRSYPSTLDPKNPSIVKDIERFLSLKS
ncbi:glutathione peroxidase [Hydrogenophaga sp.]|uniref:glutathione peroxidase n=1 Tax=Hydrogenophaga sp. TaxID=1904254 RepID=UPI00261F6912|nr:glutathione peroxidase [Hydrogenophaga sp.]